MNRIIKFRVWDKYNKRMLGWKYPVDCWLRWIDGQDSEVDIMQFTGLLDKNGVEIYEGDVVKMVLDKIIPKYALCTVTWREEYAGFNFSHLKLVNIENPGEGWSPKTSKGWEVIGNIYENPDLLTNPL